MESPNSGDQQVDLDGRTDEFAVIERLRVRFEAAAREFTTRRDGSAAG